MHLNPTIFVEKLKKEDYRMDRNENTTYKWNLNNSYINEKHWNTEKIIILEMAILKKKKEKKS